MMQATAGTPAECTNDRLERPCAAPHSQAATPLMLQTSQDLHELGLGSDIDMSKLTEEELKALKRRAANRASAKRTRERRSECKSEFNNQIEALEAEQSRLELRGKQAELQKDQLQEQISDMQSVCSNATVEGARLMQELLKLRELAGRLELAARRRKQRQPSRVQFEQSSVCSSDADRTPAGDNKAAGAEPRRLRPALEACQNEEARVMAVDIAGVIGAPAVATSLAGDINPSTAPNQPVSLESPMPKASACAVAKCKREEKQAGGGRGGHLKLRKGPQSSSRPALAVQQLPRSTKRRSVPRRDVQPSNDTTKPGQGRPQHLQPPALHNQQFLEMPHLNSDAQLHPRGAQMQMTSVDPSTMAAQSDSSALQQHFWYLQQGLASPLSCVGPGTQQTADMQSMRHPDPDLTFLDSTHALPSQTAAALDCWASPQVQLPGSLLHSPDTRIWGSAQNQAMLEAGADGFPARLQQQQMGGSTFGAERLEGQGYMCEAGPLHPWTASLTAPCTEGLQLADLQQHGVQINFGKPGCTPLESDCKWMKSDGSTWLDTRQQPNSWQGQGRPLAPPDMPPQLAHQHSLQGFDTSLGLGGEKGWEV